MDSCIIGDEWSFKIEIGINRKLDMNTFVIYVRQQHHIVHISWSVFRNIF